ncbi:MAG: energy transducer TonB [Oceanospirillales bacterium]|uniref:energy transducer TonB n=1 Tax=Thalassolituus oleivorans TaxID=187493 RepID=UPI000BDDD9B1|nr:energy transducer TonB [Thalassolituus oleivorans]PCI48526.1 MAG: energy transducer TonB [Oceanospirillales bacterium]
MVIGWLRIPLALLAGALVVAGLFWLMSRMVLAPEQTYERADNSAQINFIRQQNDSQTRTRQRELPPPPADAPPPRPPLATAQTLTPPTQALVNMPQITPSFVVGVGSIGDASIAGFGIGDSDAMPLVRMPATYPAKAKMRGIEGYVTARLSIGVDGSVTQIEVVKAEPAGIFEREAIRAMYRYKFKPKVVDGVAVEQQATQTIDFIQSK